MEEKEGTGQIAEKGIGINRCQGCKRKGRSNPGGWKRCFQDEKAKI